MGASLSKYRPAYCDEVVTFLAKGHSVGAFAGHIGVHRGTIYDWTKRHPDFGDALNIGISKAVVFWEERLIDIAKNGKATGNPAAIIFGLRNRAAQDWKDNLVTEHTGKDGGPIETKDVSAREILNARIAILASRKGQE